MKRSLEKRAARERERVRDRRRAQQRSSPPPRYLEWLDFYFGRVTPALDPWSVDIEWDFDAAGSELLHLFEYTWTNGRRDLAAFDDGQLATGLKAILMGGLSSMPTAVVNAIAPDDDKRGAIESLRWLYLDCLAPRTPSLLGHCGKSIGNPLEYVAYMLWDVSSLTGWTRVPGDRPGSSALITTLDEVLRIEGLNVACVESVLHGYNHIQREVPESRGVIVASIDRFLENCQNRTLAEYANGARSGCLL